MPTLPASLLRELQMMENFFEPQDAVMFEADLIANYGQEPIWQAISEGILEHRRLPFSGGRERCICWLTDKGREEAQQTPEQTSE